VSRSASQTDDGKVFQLRALASRSNFPDKINEASFFKIATSFGLATTARYHVRLFQHLPPCIAWHQA
jgi:hypothetical protein